MIFQSPDIRKQTIQDAENFINQKRVRRLVLLSTYKEKQSVKLSTLKGKELETFQKRAAKVDAAMQKVKDAIASLENAIAALSNTNTTIVNLEHKEIEL